MATLSEVELAQLMQTYSSNSSATYENNLSKLGVVDLDNPASINLYPKDFASKDKIADIITDYNNKQTEQGKEEKSIQIAKKLLKLNMPLEQIIEITELTKEKIENIKNK